MKRLSSIARWVLVGAGLMVVAPSARAGSAVRYALVVGNNRADADLTRMEPLRHAEQEAAKLAKNLVRYANFDSARVETVLGGDRKDVLAAATRLAQRHAADKGELGSLPTLFAFFFTGHGLSGRLLTKGGALSTDDLSGIVKEMGANLTLGFFDACYAGGLDLVSLRAKGIVVTPGFNPVAQLPKEMLDSEGTMWFASSRATEVSYEDERLGGLFMHFFGEAFTSAPADGVGISLDAMWEYARRRTADYASQRGRTQTPEMFVRSLQARGPVYFSFPRPRTATLQFDAAVEGGFVVQYAQAGLVERVKKQAGVVLEVPAFEGEVALSRLLADGTSTAPTGRFTLRKGERVLVRAEGTDAPRHSAGFPDSAIRPKGDLAGYSFTRRTLGSEVALGGGVRFTPIGDGAMGVPLQVTAGLPVFRGPISLGLAVSIGQSERAFESWSYRLQEIGVHLSGGYGIDLKPVRLDLEAMGGPSFLAVRYGSGATRDTVAGWLGAGARVSVPVPFRGPFVFLHARAMAGLRLAEGIAGSDTAAHLAFAPTLEVGLSIPFLSWPASN